MESKDIAEIMFEYYQRHAPHLRNKRCFVQYSHHAALHATDSTMHSEAENAVQIANQMYESMAKEPTGPVLRLVVDDWNHEKITNLHLYKVHNNIITCVMHNFIYTHLFKKQQNLYNYFRNSLYR